jgi:hypothetical protein
VFLDNPLTQEAIQYREALRVKGENKVARPEVRLKHQ